MRIVLKQNLQLNQRKLVNQHQQKKLQKLKNLQIPQLKIRQNHLKILVKLHLKQVLMIKKLLRKIIKRNQDKLHYLISNFTSFFVDYSIHSIKLLELDNIHIYYNNLKEIRMW